MMLPNSENSHLDAATSRRLARLGTTPVDLTRLKDAIEAEIGPPPKAGTYERPRRIGWLNPMRAAAASLLMFGLVAALVVSTASGPALASADRLARIHAEVQGHDGSQAHQVSSVAEANAVLSGKAPGVPPLPDVPANHVHFCCVQTLGRKPVSCVAVMVGKHRVTVAVADAKDVRVPEAGRRTLDGQTYVVQSRGGLNMVMASRGGQWVCVMGEVPVGLLLEISRGIRR